MTDLAPRLRTMAWATLVANCLLVVTGGAVRLTGSGLGCPTWPRCSDAGFTPHGAFSIHKAIEFGNRTLTFVLTAIAIATFVAAFQAARRTGRTELRTVALLLALSIPAQAVLGGITVLTDLNPWVVSAHLMFSLAIIALAVVFLRMTDARLPAPSAPRPALLLAWSTAAACALVLYVGTVVTGSGPHAGDEKAPRNGLSPLQLSQLHADLVFLFVGLTLGLFFVLWATGARPEALGAVRLLLIAEIAQGAIGFVQYFTDLPIVLVGFHMLGAAVITAATTWTVLEAREAR
jgi:cytochrome c oxidase assembly protein subunit 15